MDKIKVLVVDDAAFMRDIVKKGVRSQFPDFQVDEANNGKQAQARLTDTEYDLILCDWEMPELKGDELLQWIRSRPETEKLPFVMVTSRGDREHVVRAIELGVNNYIVKPFTAEKLAGVVIKTLSKAKNLPPSAFKGKPVKPSRNLGNDSAEILTRGRDVGRSGAVPVAETIGGEKDKPLSATPKKKVIAQLRFGDNTVACLIKQIDESQVVVVIKRGDAVPQVLELAAFDFSTEDDEQVSRMNAFVHTLQARENSQESEFINVTLRFVDEDDEKLEHLRRYIAAVGE